MSATYLTGTEPLVAQLARAVGYKGRKFRLVTTESVRTWSRWDSGSKDTFTMVRLADMATVDASYNPGFIGPCDPDASVETRPGFVCVEHTIFQGKDMGLTFHVHPKGLDPRLLPEKIAISDHERIVLYATRSYKASYAGIPDYRFVEATRATAITRDQWNAAKASLIACKLLNKAGAITTKGKNAVSGIHSWPKLDK